MTKSSAEQGFHTSENYYNPSQSPSKPVPKVRSLKQPHRYENTLGLHYPLDMDYVPMYAAKQPTKGLAFAPEPGQEVYEYDTLPATTQVQYTPARQTTPSGSATLPTLKSKQTDSGAIPKRPSKAPRSYGSGSKADVEKRQEALRSLDSRAPMSTREAPVPTPKAQHTLKRRDQEGLHAEGATGVNSAQISMQSIENDSIHHYDDIPDDDIYDETRLKSPNSRPPMPTLRAPVRTPKPRQRSVCIVKLKQLKTFQPAVHQEERGFQDNEATGMNGAQISMQKPEQSIEDDRDYDDIEEGDIDSRAAFDSSSKVQSCMSASSTEFCGRDVRKCVEAIKDPKTRLNLQSRRRNNKVKQACQVLH
jgi:hypothetical protein